MTTDSYAQIAPNSTGPKVDTSELTVGSNTVERQRMVVGDSTLATGLQEVKASGEAMVASERLEFQMEQVIVQLKMMNLHLAYLTGITLDDRDALLAIFN